MKVYHPAGGVFDPYAVCDGMYEGDDGNMHSVDNDLARWCEAMVDWIDDGRFRVDSKMKSVQCRNCGGDKFYAGRHRWQSYLKCSQCGIECCIHEG